MRIAIASDHAALALKSALVEYLCAAGHDVSDLGPYDETSVDYPDYGYKLANAIADGSAERGVALCGSGIGISMAVNRNSAARAALVAGDAPAALAALVSERAKGRPISHLTGTRGFRALELLVTPDVLDPRPETELVVETALAYLADRVSAARALGRAPQPLNAAEIGTGSGAIAIAIASESPAPLRLTATDISGEALAVARANALRAGVASRITFLHGDLAEPLLAARAPGDPAHLDLLLANLPYVPSDEVDAARSAIGFQRGAESEPTPRDLSQISIAAEPRLALDGGSDGLECIRRLIAELPRLLRPGAAAILEFGDGQADAVSALVGGLGLGWRVSIRGDLSGRARVAEIRRSG